MPVNQAELGRRLKVAREACQMTQEQVAVVLGLSRPSITQIEAGNRSVSSIELSQLAFAFGRELREFLSDSFDEEDALSALFRAEASVEDRPEVAQSLRGCIALGRELANLQHLLDVDRDLAVPSYPLLPPKDKWEAVTQGNRIADEERRRLCLGSSPIPDLLNLLEAQGVITEEVDLPEEISGITIFDRQIGSLVVANRSQHIWRRRFSLAHEYGHVLMDRASRAMVSRTSERQIFSEVRANTFAASFLLPEEGVRLFVEGLGKGRPSRMTAEVFDEAGVLDVNRRPEAGSQAIQFYDVVMLAYQYGVSSTAAIYRLLNLKIISKAESEALRIADRESRGEELARSLGLELPRHNDVRAHFSRRFLSFCLEAYRREAITLGKLRELAGMPGVFEGNLEDLLDQAGLADDEPHDVLLPG